MRKVILGIVGMLAMSMVTHAEMKTLNCDKEIETKYNVICTGDSSAVLTLFYFPVTYHAKCTSDLQTLHLKIVSVVKTAKDGTTFFKLKKYQVRF